MDYNDYKDWSDNLTQPRPVWQTLLFAFGSPLAYALVKLCLWPD